MGALGWLLNLDFAGGGAVPETQQRPVSFGLATNISNAGTASSQISVAAGFATEVSETGTLTEGSS